MQQVPKRHQHPLAVPVGRGANLGERQPGVAVAHAIGGHVQVELHRAGIARAGAVPREPMLIHPLQIDRLRRERLQRRAVFVAQRQRHFGLPLRRRIGHGKHFHAQAVAQRQRLAEGHDQVGNPHVVARKRRLRRTPLGGGPHRAHHATRREGVPERRPDARVLVPFVPLEEGDEVGIELQGARDRIAQRFRAVGRIALAPHVCVVVAHAHAYAQQLALELGLGIDLANDPRHVGAEEFRVEGPFAVEDVRRRIVAIVARAVRPAQDGAQFLARLLEILLA